MDPFVEISNWNLHRIPSSPGMMSDNDSQSAALSHPSKIQVATRRTAKSSPICRTCGKCRAKKVKCDGTRPRCGLCVSSDHACSYPEDARKSGRLTKAEIEALQKEVAGFRQLYKEHRLNSGPRVASPNLGQDQSQPAARDDSPHRTPAQHFQSELRTPPLSSYDAESRYEGETRTTPQFFDTPAESGEAEIEESESPSCTETRIAGAIAEGRVIHVHGITSVLHQSSPRSHPNTKAMSPAEQRMHIQMVKDQLFSNAALQRQRETSIMGTPSRGLGHSVDFDGLHPEMAIHLLDLHWNRTHFAFLLTYRPSIIDSMSNNGPYCNKLLLNAIYYSSSHYSDRVALRADGNDPQSVGQQFYMRFKQLLVEEIDRPSIPTVVALLLCGAALVSNGAQSAGWIMCGTAYRMVTDLGCHLSIQGPGDPMASRSKLTSMEIEMRKRVYWGAFLTDKFQSLYLGRPSALRRGEARVPKVLLDSYEELENWSPYIDPATPTASNLPSYQPQPAYAVSTFLSLITLGEIASAIACTFYRFESLRTPRNQLLKMKAEVESDLDSWIKNLPAHLHFDPSVDPIPPPHQITPHTTYHTLIILLERPFLPGGHLASLSDPQSQSVGESRCIAAALRIWHLVDAYKRAFTLRRAPYLLSYAAYSAIVVILNQTQACSDQYVDCIQFFWYALLDLQKGCNSGLGKPMKILQTLFQRLGQTVPGWDPRDPANHGSILLQDPSDESLAGNAENSNGAAMNGALNMTFGDLPAVDFLFYQGMGIENVSEDWLESMTQDQGLMDDSLFGLFTPGQPAMNF